MCCFPLMEGLLITQLGDSAMAVKDCSLMDLSLELSTKGED